LPIFANLCSCVGPNDAGRTDNRRQREHDAEETGDEQLQHDQREAQQARGAREGAQ
jgi:hypothetical protein